MSARGLFAPSLSIAILRISLGLVFMAHATIRLVDYTLPGFGDFLQSKGFPGGFYLAWSVTLFELLGGACMLLRLFVKWFCVGEILILVTGIILVHSVNGWFVVGKTLGGMEYSVVLILVLLAVLLAEIEETRSSRRFPG